MSFFSNASLVRNGNTIVDIKGISANDSIVNSQGFQDASTLYTWYQEDPMKNHLKLQSWFGQQEMTHTPLFQDVLQHDAVLEVNGWDGKFTYDLPIETDSSVKTVEDLSYQQYAGMDGTTFKITLNREFAPNTQLTCDGLDGDAIAVSDSEPVVNLGYGFEHTVTLLTKDPDKTYPSELLAKNIQYFEIGHGIAEWGERLGLVHMPGATNYMTCEFQLGSGMGYETMFSGKADSVDLKQGVTSSMDYIKEIEKFYKEGKELILMREKRANGSHRYTVGSILEMLTIQKFNKQMSTSLMFSKAGEIQTQKGTVKYNEGLWRQFRRGEIITYGRPGGIKRSHLKQARDYVFKANPYANTISSKIKFKCGTEAYNNILELFKDEVNNQLQNIAPLLGSDRVLPKNPVSGDLYNLSLEPIRWTNVNLPGIGMVEIIEDIAMNNVGVTDKNLRGMHPRGADYTTYSMIIWDAADQEYSNNQEVPKGTKLIGNNSEANIYLVTPKGDKVYWGRENGRYDASRASDIVASAKTMHSSFFIYGFGSCWMKDPSKFVSIELEKSARKNYN